MGPVSTTTVVMMLSASTAWAAMQPPPAYGPAPSAPPPAAPPAYGPPPAMTSAPADACVAKCVEKMNACKVATDANMATCTSNFAACVNTNVFGGPNGSFMIPTACGSFPTTTTAPAPPAYGPTHSTTTMPATDSCVEKCNKEHSACQVTRDNQASCAAEYAKCLDFNPYQSGGYVTPTACGPNAGGATTTSYPAPPAAPSAPAGADTCVVKCVDKMNACKLATDANMATCTSNFAACVNTNVFGGPNGSFMIPTACGSTHTTTATATAPPAPPATPSASATAPPAGCAATCNKAYDACISATDANRAVCAGKLASCVGYNPFSAAGSFVTPTACTTKPANATSSMPAIYTGGASLFTTGGSLVAMVAGAVGLML